MDKYSDRSKKAAAIAAVKAIIMLSLQAGADKTELTVRLCKYLVVIQSYVKFSPPSLRREKEANKRIVREIENNIVLRRSAFEKGKLDVLDDMKAFIESIEPSKGGRPPDRISAATGLFLAKLYYEATGKAPGHKSGINGGPFHRFVAAALISTNLTVNTVTKKGVNLWKYQKDCTPPTLQKSEIKYLSIYQVFAKNYK